MRPRGSGTRERAAVAGLLALYLLAAGTAMRRDSSVADEHPHILSGYLYWKSGRFAGGLENPPLGQLVVSAPLVLLHRLYRFPSDESLAWCRLPVLLSGLALGLVLWRWGRGLGGTAAGLVALAGVCVEPDLLAHAHVATLDFLVTVLWWLALWEWRRAVLSGDASSDGRGFGPLFAFAAFAATAVLVKLTGLLLVPAAALAALVSGAPWRRRRALQAVFLSVAATFLLAHVVYGFGPVRHGVPEKLLMAMQGKLAHRAEVRFAYLAGRRSENGFLSYYPVALALKTPLPLLGLAAFGAWRLLRRGQRGDAALLLVPAAAVVVAFTAIRVNLGVRHVLPVHPALLLLAGVAVPDLWARRRMRPVVATLLVCWAAGVARVAPQYFPYFNLLAGGPAGGHRWLLDSNLDWGQDDGRLAAFLASPAGTGYTVDPDPERPRTGRLAVSTNALYNLQRLSSRPYSWLRSLPPRGFAGFAWRLYELDRADYERQAAALPHDPAAVWGLSSILVAEGDTTRARSLLEESVQRMPDLAAKLELVVLAARGASERRSWDEARGWVRRGLALRSSEPELQFLRQWFELEVARQEAAPEARARIALELGLFRGERGEVEAALPALEEAAAALPGDAEAQRAVAVARGRLGDFAGAVAILDRPEIAGRFPAERDLCARFAAAEQALDRDDAPVDPDLLFELARSHFDAARYDAAARALVRLLQERPDHRDALAYLCEMQVRSKMRTVEERLEPRIVWPDAAHRRDVAPAR